MASVIECCRCQSLATPSLAEYWRIGDTTMRFGTLMGPSASGENKVEAMAKASVSDLTSASARPPPLERRTCH